MTAAPGSAGATERSSFRSFAGASMRRALIGVAALAIGAAFSLQLLAQRNQDDELRRTGTPADGTVIYRTGGSRYQQEAELVRFVTAEGAVIDVRLEVGSGGRHEVGNRVGVVYDPVDPRRAAFQTPQRLAYRALLSIPAALIGIAVLVNESTFFWAVRRTAKRQDGRPVRATRLTRGTSAGIDEWVEVVDERSIDRIFFRLQRGQGSAAMPTRLHALGRFRLGGAVVLVDDEGGRWWPRGRVRRGVPWGAS